MGFSRRSSYAAVYSSGKYAKTIPLVLGEGVFVCYSGGMKYVSPEYQKQLEDLAETLVTPERFGQLALSGEVQLVIDFEVPENVELGVE